MSPILYQAKMRPLNFFQWKKESSEAGAGAALVGALCHFLLGVGLSDLGKSQEKSLLKTSPLWPSVSTLTNTNFLTELRLEHS